MKINPRDPIDTLLDSSLKSYAEVEPLNGLEDRILNRARLAQPKIRIRRGRLLLATGATLGLSWALSCLFLGSFEQNKIESKKEVVRVAPLNPQLSSPSTVPILRKPQVKHPRGVRRLPKLDTFPSIQHPNAEERAILHFIEKDPKQAAQVFAGLQRQMDAPLEIKPLEIEPLDADEMNN